MQRRQTRTSAVPDDVFVEVCDVVVSLFAFLFMVILGTNSVLTED